MLKYILKIDGMMCGMCEAHINEAIRAAFNVKKVSSSHSKGETVIITEAPLDEARLADTVGGTGYTLVSVKDEPYEKKGFFSFLIKKSLFPLYSGKEQIKSNKLARANRKQEMT